MPEHQATGGRVANANSHSWHLNLAYKLSWVVNWLLLGIKIYAFAVSRSKAVLASMADSAGTRLCKSFCQRACALISRGQ